MITINEEKMAMNMKKTKNAMSEGFEGRKGEKKYY